MEKEKNRREMIKWIGAWGNKVEESIWEGIINNKDLLNKSHMKTVYCRSFFTCMCVCIYVCM